jgi:hypothetical protein
LYVQSLEYTGFPALEPQATRRTFPNAIFLAIRGVCKSHFKEIGDGQQAGTKYTGFIPQYCS